MQNYYNYYYRWDDIINTVNFDKYSQENAEYDLKNRK